MKKVLSFLLLTVISFQTFADVPIWGQCGGINFPSGSTCAAGSVCVRVNDYYSQCMGAGPTLSGSVPNIHTTTKGFEDFATGNYVLIRTGNDNPGAASVSPGSYIRQIVYQKTIDDSKVGGGFGTYNVTWKATYTTSSVSTGSVDILDARQIQI